MSEAEKFSGLAVCAEDIPAGASVVIASGTNLAYSAGQYSGLYCGTAMENLREGFRISIKDGEAREDDA